MAGYIGAKVGTVTANAADIKGDISATDTTPEITLKNTTETDADGSRGGKITFKGEQSGGEESTLANIQASHDGTADDEKGDLIFRTNDGSDGASPTERMRIDSVGTVTITNASNDTQLLLESTDADASSGPVLELFRNSASPADNDLGGAIEFHAENDADEKIRYQAIFTYLPDVSDGSEDGAFQHYIIKDGTQIQRMEHSPTETVFNQDGAAIDFRVESDTNANMFVVDGGDNIVLVGGTTNTAGGNAFKVGGAGNDGEITLHADGTQSYITCYDRVGGVYHPLRIDAYGINFFRSGTQIAYFNEQGNKGFINGEGGTGYNLYANAAATTAFAMRLDSASGSTGAANIVQIVNGYGQVGGITTNGAATQFNTSSDYRLKENVANITDGITRIKQLSPKKFNWINDETNTLVDGFLAHEAQTVVPEAITGTKDEVHVWLEDEELPEGVSVGDNKLDDDGNTIPKMQGIDQAKLVPLLTAALQEAIAKIETLETKVAALEAE